MGQTANHGSFLCALPLNPKARPRFAQKWKLDGGAQIPVVNYKYMFRFSQTVHIDHPAFVP
jgi:hypothetical protein